jgi:hypothetical protein
VNRHAWDFPNLRGDPIRSESVRWGKQLFAMTPPHRPLIALVDYDLVAASDHSRKLNYLFQLLSEDLIEANLYADEGPASSAQLHWYFNGSGKKIDAYKDWIEVRPGTHDWQRLFAWFKEGKPFHRIKTISDSAYERVVAAEPPPEYKASGDADRLVRADAMAMLAAKAISADIFVTERRLPHLLGHDPWSRVTVLTPENALPLVGLYLRSQGRCVITHYPILGRPHGRQSQQTRNKFEFYWWASEALLSEEYRWQSACRESSQATGDDMVETLQWTVVQRLKQSLQSRDRLLVRLAVPQDWDTADDVLNELDQLLVWIMGAFDAVARVAHIALGNSMDELKFASWDNERWVREVGKKESALGSLVTGYSAGKRVFDILSPLRNLIHGPPLSARTVILVIGDHALETWVAIPAGDRMKILNSMRALGGLDAWGIRYPLKEFASQYPTTKDDPYIHPGMFVERLLPYAISLLNDLMAAVPVDSLPGVSGSYAVGSMKMPLGTADERSLWQLAIGTV